MRNRKPDSNVTASKAPYDDELVLEKFVALMREPKRFPTEAALQMKRLSDMAFPNSKAFLRFGKTKHNGSRRFESTAEPEQAMRIYCRFVMLH